MRTLINCKSYFDGYKHFNHGPYSIEICDGIIQKIHSQDISESIEPEITIFRTNFIMPGLVEGHCHLFLNGEELDFLSRKEYLKSSLENMLTVAKKNIKKNIACGITLIRDAGDIHGINNKLKEILQDTVPELRSPGKAIRKQKRYGSFMGIEVNDTKSIVNTIRELTSSADDLKVLMTGIIDFEKGEMKGKVQFDQDEANLIVKTAKECKLKTYTHCSGIEGLKISCNAGFDSIEHGFFMNQDILNIMAEKQISWVPTFSPVYFQYARPELAGWNEETVGRLKQILDNHFLHIEMADRMGVPIITGSDAGSYGVPHGKSLIDELMFLSKAGIQTDRVLMYATSVARKMWGCPSADITQNNQVNFISLKKSPFEDIQNLNTVDHVFYKNVVFENAT
jgi:imidazolonepropionase-like amidohydrolase